MATSLHCLSCGHNWNIRSDKPINPQCPRCRRHRIIANEIYEKTVVDLVRLLRGTGRKDPLEDFSYALDHAREMIKTTFPDPILAGQAAFEVVREALKRLGFPLPL